MDQASYYFKFLEDDKLKSYDSLVFVQIARCLFIGSNDNSTSGKMWIQDAAGNHREIIRDDYSVAFINSVRMLHSLMEKKVGAKLIKNLEIDKMKTYEDAHLVFRKLMEMNHTSGLFGHKDLMVVWGKNGTASIEDKGESA